MGIWGVIPSLSIVAGMELGGPLGPRPRCDILPLIDTTHGGAAAIFQRRPAVIAVLAHTGRRRAAIRNSLVAVIRDSRFSAKKRRGG